MPTYVLQGTPSSWRGTPVWVNRKILAVYIYPWDRIWARLLRAAGARGALGPIS